MKKIKDRFAGMRAPVPIFCYLAALCAGLLIGLFHFSYDAVQTARGEQRTLTLSPGDFALSSMELQADGSYLSTTADPQLVLDTLPTGVRRFSVETVYDRDPYERCLYYTQKPGQPFSEHMRVWPTYSDDGRTAYYELPVGVRSLRLDPGSLTALRMEFGDLVLNPPRSFFSYFTPDGGGWFCLAVLPALAASVLKWLIECKRHYFDKERKQQA
ncbi:MAG: hypothetical protein Q4G07_10120 [Oscillospiraceae bacterium]|nr:hypothetical protein [Oscillospiraceae bacterium]